MRPSVSIFPVGRYDFDVRCEKCGLIVTVGSAGQARDAARNHRRYEHGERDDVVDLTETTDRVEP